MWSNPRLNPLEVGIADAKLSWKGVAGVAIWSGSSKNQEDYTVSTKVDMDVIARWRLVKTRLEVI